MSHPLPEVDPPRIREHFPHAVREIENTWIPLADGTRLAARIWLPVDAEENPVPAVLEYLPYRKDDATAGGDAMRHPYFAGHGYAAVRVDLRGTGDSDGLLAGEYLQQEHDDGLEVLSWLEAQPWCTGSVGMIGYSWGGFNALQLAALRPPQLKAVITHASTDDRYLDDCHYMGGCLLGSDMLKWGTAMTTYPISPPDPRHVGERWREMWLHRLENAPQFARDWITHQRRDEFWKQGSVAEDYSAITCPVMAVGGWADAYTNAVPRLLEHLDVPRLGLIGPWGHMFPYQGIPGPAIGFLQECVRWWDRWLKGVDNDVMEEPLLRAWIEEYVPPAGFHAMRPGRWIAEESWPPTSVNPQVRALPGEGPVAVRGHQECGETAGVWCANGNADEIATDQRPDDERSLVFDFDVPDEGLELLGNPVVRLRVSADRPLALVAARLENVAPDGSSLLVSWGMLNLTHRDRHGEPMPLEVGRTYDVDIELRVCGHRFAPGHRLRLALSPTYWPHAWPSPEPVTLTVHLGDASALVLPVRTPQSGDADPPRFEPAEIAPPHPPGPGDRDERRREVRVDPASGRREIVDTETHVNTVAPHGIVLAETGRDTYAITPGDPLSAGVHCVRETRSSGVDRDWAVRVESQMTCEASAFIVTERIDAWDGDEHIFGTVRHHKIERDLL
jgi:hypothetical protein